MVATVYVFICNNFQNLCLRWDTGISHSVQVGMIDIEKMTFTEKKGGAKTAPSPDGISPSPGVHLTP